MPIKKCMKDGVSGFKYGDSGHCYTGPGALEKAKKQAAAIKISQNKGKGSRMYQIVASMLGIHMIDEEHEDDIEEEDKEDNDKEGSD